MISMEHETEINQSKAASGLFGRPLTLLVKKKRQRRHLEACAKASKLIAVGFEFVYEYNGVMMYRRHR